MATTPTKTIQSVPISWQDVATGSQVFSSVVDVSTKWGGAFDIRLGRQSTTAFTAGWPKVRVEASCKSSGNDDWSPILTYQMQVGSSVAKTTLTATATVGATSLGVASTSNMAVGDILFVGDSTVTNYETARVKSLGAGTVTVEEALTYGHANSSTVSNQAETPFPSIDLSDYTRIRIVLDNANGGQTVSGQVGLTTFDSFGA